MSSGAMPSTDTYEVCADGAMSVDEGTAFLGVSRAEIYREMARGRLAYVIRGRRRLIPRRAAVAWLADGLRGGECRPAA